MNINCDIFFIIFRANVRLGEHNKSTGQDCVPVSGGGYDCNDEPVIIPVETIIIHEDYNPQIKHTHDIALIRMTKEAPTTCNNRLKN